MTPESHWLENSSHYDSRIIIYNHRGFIRLATGTFLQPTNNWNKPFGSLNDFDLKINIVVRIELYLRY